MSDTVLIGEMVIRMKKAFILGLASSFFFAFTFVLNRSMNLSGGSWIWSGTFRFFFAFPIMAAIVGKKHGFQNIHKNIKQHPREWLLWSTVGFGLFYAPLCFAGNYGQSWLIAASWQITIVMGVLMAPLFGKRIPIKHLGAAGVILTGVVFLQIGNVTSFKLSNILLTLLPISIGAISYPLGNRKMMAVSGSQLSTEERTYGMILCSLPFWCLLSLFGLASTKLPAPNQLLQAFLVALFSGVIATLLFFKATDSVKSNQKQLAVIESTQSGEVLFTLLGGILLLGDELPGLWGFAGILLIIFGMILNSAFSSHHE